MKVDNNAYYSQIKKQPDSATLYRYRVELSGCLYIAISTVPYRKQLINTNKASLLLATVNKWIRAQVNSISFGDEGDSVEEIKTIDVLDKIIYKHAETTLLLFKHSTACPISMVAYREVIRFLEKADAASPPVYMVKVIESRSVSNAIASRYAVKHQSPQILLVHADEVLWDASHGRITCDALQNAINTNRV